MSSSQSCSHRNSVQNGQVERSTALTATLYVKSLNLTTIQQNVVITKVFAPKFCAEWSNRELHSSHGYPFREKSLNLTTIQKHAVITKLFAPKICAECTDRDLHSSHGDPFREDFFVMQWFAILRVKSASFDILMVLLVRRGVEVYSHGGYSPEVAVISW